VLWCAAGGVRGDGSWAEEALIPGAS